ncbi:hypothetical protein, partial [Salmonella sp. s54836]|uniref:hypothetical protein n=1 Tax=Salmonella sp. s54836 TaxID=3159673 RepID=UPI003980A814
MSFIPQPMNIYAQAAAAQLAQTSSLPATVNNTITSIPHTSLPTTPSYLQTQQHANSSSLIKNSIFGDYVEKIKDQYLTLENKNNALRAEFEK